MTAILESRMPVLDSPIGTLTVSAGPQGVARIWFADEQARAEAGRGSDDCVEQLGEYFAGDRREFDLPLDMGGTDFQRSVWAALQAIPFGKTTTYGEIAHALGDAKLVRAVGAAVGATSVPIVVPCHRVVGSDGSLTGYRGGIERKAALLALEARVAGDQLALL